jgi:hypothetical protein
VPSRDPKVRHNGRPSRHFEVVVGSSGVRALVLVLSVALVGLLRLFVVEVSLGKKLLFVVMKPVSWHSLLVTDGRHREFRLVCVVGRNSFRCSGMCVIDRLVFCLSQDDSRKDRLLSA